MSEYQRKALLEYQCTCGEVITLMRDEARFYKNPIEQVFVGSCSCGVQVTTSLLNKKLLN